MRTDGETRPTDSRADWREGWEVFAVDSTGASVDHLESFAGVVVRIERNRAYVEDAEGWRDTAIFESPTVMELDEGTLRYMDLDIVARRGPQDGIFVVVWTEWFGEEPGEHASRLLVGCGVRTVDSDGRQLGVSQESRDFLAQLVTDLRGEGPAWDVDDLDRALDWLERARPR